MVNDNELVIGRCYFLISFLDEEMRIPEIETYIYIGKNLISESDVSDESGWYFQDPESYLKHGPFKSTRKNLGRDVVCVDENTLDLFCELPVLISRLSKIR